jgi:transcriptional regulatory protein RtcR
MSALFGHVKGAFTGAQKDRAGLLRAAHKGVLFLDEIGELGLDEQAMLLRALEERTFLPLGSDEEAHRDFQLIAGTNRDLFAAVRQGRFREDLLARINLWTFSLPGLKHRVEDIEPNLDFELDRFAERAGRCVTFSKQAREKFLNFALSPASDWPRPECGCRSHGNSRTRWPDFNSSCGGRNNKTLRGLAHNREFAARRPSRTIPHSESARGNGPV